MVWWVTSCDAMRVRNVRQGIGCGDTTPTLTLSHTATLPPRHPRRHAQRVCNTVGGCSHEEKITQGEEGCVIEARQEMMRSHSHSHSVRERGDGAVQYRTSCRAASRWTSGTPWMFSFLRTYCWRSRKEGRTG